MRVVCSYCRKSIRTEAGGRADAVSHGMCPECDAHFSRLWAGMPLAEYLDGLPAPVLVVDADGRVVAANGRVAALVGSTPEALRGVLGGEAMACARSRLPEGCGRTVHCRECAIRNSVTRVGRTGTPLEHVPAWLETAAGRVELRISARPVSGLVEVTIEERSTPAAPGRGGAGGAAALAPATDPE